MDKNAVYTYALQVSQKLRELGLPATVPYVDLTVKERLSQVKAAVHPWLIVL